MKTKEIDQFYDAIIDSCCTENACVDYGVIYDKLDLKHPEISAAHHNCAGILIGKEHYARSSYVEQMNLIREAVHLYLQLQDLYSGRKYDV